MNDVDGDNRIGGFSPLTLLFLGRCRAPDDPRGTCRRRRRVRPRSRARLLEGFQARQGGTVRRGDQGPQDGPCRPTNAAMPDSARQNPPATRPKRSSFAPAMSSSCSCRSTRRRRTSYKDPLGAQGRGSKDIAKNYANMMKLSGRSRRPQGRCRQGPRQEPGANPQGQEQQRRCHRRHQEGAWRHQGFRRRCHQGHQGKQDARRCPRRHQQGRRRQVRQRGPA